MRVYAARTVRWRGIFAVHSWIVVKEPTRARYTRYDYTAWGEPIRINGFAADGRWFGDRAANHRGADGEAAERMIPKIRAAVENYEWRSYGDYRAWPGPNSNTFVTAVLAAVPELRAALPPTAIGKDFPYDGEMFGLDAVGNRRSRQPRRLSRADRRLGRRHRGQFSRRGVRHRSAAAGGQVAGAGAAGIRLLNWT